MEEKRLNIGDMMRKPILCEDCKKQIGTIEEDALVMDAEYGHIGITVCCKDCKKKTYEYKERIDENDLIKNLYVR